MADFSIIFHQFSKDRARGRRFIPQGTGDEPDEWKTTYYKTYPRLKKINLEADTPISADFFDLAQRRRSRRNFNRGPVKKSELSLLLKYACGETGMLPNGRKGRAQPSGGSKFPIEIYPIVFRSSESLEAGTYHYNVQQHTLDMLWGREFSDDDVKGLFTYPWVKDAAVGIIMTGVFWRNQIKYGERGYRMVLQESGHIGQNIYLVCEALGLKCCAIAGTKDGPIEGLLDIDGATESLIYAIAVGK